MLGAGMSDHSCGAIEVRRHPISTAVSATDGWTKQFVVFVLGGILSAIADVGLTAVLLMFGIWYVAAVSAGFLLSLCLNFLYHAKITFAIRLSKAVAIRYLLITGANYCLTLAIVVLVREASGGSTMLGKIVSIPIIALHGYLWGRLWVFRVLRHD